MKNKIICLFASTALVMSFPFSAAAQEAAEYAETRVFPAPKIYYRESRDGLESTDTELPEITDTENESVSYSENDLYWLSRLIEAEASGESYTGKVAAGACVVNRVASADFPNDIYSVIFDTKYGVQYQPTTNNTIYNTPSDDSVAAAKDALSGISPVGNALYFCSVRVAATSWMAANRPYCTTIGNHVFYM